MPWSHRWFRSVLTPAGFAAAVLALVVLTHSLALRNAYEIALSAGLLCFLLILGLAGAWGAGRLADLAPGWTIPAPLGANTLEEALITGLGPPVPWFFRFHIILRGRFFPGGARRGYRWAAETSTPRGDGSARLGLRFPMSGLFRGESLCRLRDIFGFFSFPCGKPGLRILTIRTAPHTGGVFRIEAHSGAEDRRNKAASDEERYYMREYAPGDRFRDINWKSSDRIDTLITRVSPDTQEKVNRIEVYFRNYGPAGRDSRVSLEELWLLDRAKARLARFLRSVKEEHAKYVFHVRAAEGVWEINNQDEIELFLEELAGLPFSPPRGEGFGDSGTPSPASPGDKGDLYVFSTACDRGLGAFLAALQSRPVFLFFCRPAVPGIPPGEVEKLYLRDFAAGGVIPFPPWPPLRRDSPDRFLNPPEVSGGGAELGYAEVRW
ncbi:MAG: DUF58 domain-containing protein [Spirochaetaceae bacterium]|jgi:hypothetical protein|nr:DUF58 domain-containing protein [Spirochaetaceae bacterium]